MIINKKKAGIPIVDDMRPISAQNKMLKILNVAQEIREAAMKTSKHQ